MKIRKRHNEKVHRHERKSLFLLQSDYNRITVGLQSGYNHLHHPLHLDSTQYKQFPQKKKKQKKEAKDKGERQNEGKEKERKEVKKRRRRKRDGKSLFGRRERGRVRGGRKDEDEEEGEGKEEERRNTENGEGDT